MICPICSANVLRFWIATAEIVRFEIRFFRFLVFRLCLAIVIQIVQRIVGTSISGSATFKLRRASLRAPVTAPARLPCQRQENEKLQDRVVLLKIEQPIPQASQQVNVHRCSPSLFEGLPHQIENGR